MSDQPVQPLLVISGGSGYIGAAIVAAFKVRGWTVITLSRTKGEASDEFSMSCDISNEDAVKKAIQQVVERYGKIDACIHAAATSLERVSILEASKRSLEDTMAVAYFGAVYLARAVIAQMRSGGSFIGITSQVVEADVVTNPLMGGYLPAKYALRGFLRALASAPEAHALRVHAIAPGFLPGGLNSDLPPIVQRVIAHQSGTLASCDALGELAYTIAADPNAYLPGTSIQFPSKIAQPL